MAMLNELCSENGRDERNERARRRRKKELSREFAIQRRESTPNANDKGRKATQWQKASQNRTSWPNINATVSLKEGEGGREGAESISEPDLRSDGWTDDVATSVSCYGPNDLEIPLARGFLGMERERERKGRREMAWHASLGVAVPTSTYKAVILSSRRDGD